MMAIFLFVDSIIYAFNVDVTKNILTQAEKLDVPVKQYDIIYKLLDDLKVTSSQIINPKGKILSFCYSITQVCYGIATLVS